MNETFTRRRLWGALLTFSASAAVLALPARAFAQDRSLFEKATTQRCFAQQRAHPANATRSDAALMAYCGCYAGEMARTVPADILNTSRDAATPEQAKALQRLMEAAGEKCQDRLP